MSTEITFVDAVELGVSEDDWRRLEELPKRSPVKKAALRALRLAKQVSRLERQHGGPIVF